MVFYATVAQQVEQLIRNQQVAGSSPASSSKKKNPFRGSSFLLFYMQIRAGTLKTSYF